MVAQAPLTVLVSYTLSPPMQANAPPSLASNATHAFPIGAEKMANGAEYYKALQSAIVAAREKLGEELTAWRDAVGSTEAGKEKAAKAARTEDEEEDEEEEGADSF